MLSQPLVQFVVLRVVFFFSQVVDVVLVHEVPEQAIVKVVSPVQLLTSFR